MVTTVSVPVLHAVDATDVMSTDIGQPHRLTDYNVAISVVSLFILLVKMIMIIMKFFYPILGLIVSLGLTVVYTVSVYGQAGPDYADPEHPSPVPWYIAKSCSVARPFNAEKNCQIAKGAFAATIYML